MHQQLGTGGRSGHGRASPVCCQSPPPARAAATRVFRGRCSRPARGPYPSQHLRLGRASPRRPHPKPGLAAVTLPTPSLPAKHPSSPDGLGKGSGAAPTADPRLSPSGARTPRPGRRPAQVLCRPPSAPPPACGPPGERGSGEGKRGTRPSEAAGPRARVAVTAQPGRRPLAAAPSTPPRAARSAWAARSPGRPGPRPAAPRPPPLARGPPASPDLGG